MRMSEVLAAECGGRPVVVLSGPNLAEEIARGLPATTVAASQDAGAARQVQAALNTSRFRVYTHDDMVGVELGGALKNIIALGAGINDGLGYGDNAKAALITRGLAEITRLGVALGANPLTFAGLSGLGDLIATCASPLSRNRRVGEELGRGRTLETVLSSLGHVAEGVPTTAAAHALAARCGVEMPIVEEMHRVLFENRPAADAARALMEREPRAELTL
jgi:glycerol-3-phosphate dehydrogenase (NAD(P)+)